MNGAAVSIEKLSKRYRYARNPALVGIDLEIPDGSFYGLLGPNGAGKTTLLSILCGILAPSGGLVGIDDGRGPMPPVAARGMIGYVPQELAFYPSLSVRENLAFFGAMHSLEGDELVGRINACVDLAQLAAFRHKRAGELSGGLKRRLNFAIAMLHTPRLLVLDEPTAGVDAQSRRFLQEELKRLHRGGTTILYTSHYLDELEGLCDHLAIIDAGRIIASGPAATLLAKGTIEVRPARAATPAELARIAKAISARDIHQHDGVMLVEVADPSIGLARVLEALRAEDIAVIEAKLGSRSLESLFFTLTGFQLRDDDGESGGR